MHGMGVALSVPRPAGWQAATTARAPAPERERSPIFLKGEFMRTTRRDFLRTTVAGTLLAGVPARWAGTAYASDAPETPTMRIGIIAMTDPPGTHAMWMRYWLAAGGLNPDRDVTLITIPPAQMVANMKVGKMDGYCVGEPWGARAIADGIGFTAITTQQIWKDHPEKVLGFTEEFATKNPKTVKAVMRAILEASQWNDKLENRPKMAEVVGQPQYVNAAKEVILGRMLGEYDYGDGRREKDKYYMTFFDRQTNFPMKSHGVWWLTQFRRWGMVKEAPDYKGLVDRVHRPDIYREAAKEMGIETPRGDSQKETFFDGGVFDPADPEKYVKSFAVHTMGA